jgi:hypothetical protein
MLDAVCWMTIPDAEWGFDMEWEEGDGVGVPGNR